MAKLKPVKLGHGLMLTTAAERLGHIKSGMRQTGSTKTQMWGGGLKGSQAQMFAGKMKRKARGW